MTTLGTILREEWANVSGNNVSDIPLNTAPTSTSYLTSLEGPTNHGSNYGARISGLIYPGTTANYTFWVAADDSAELWLSTDSTPGKIVKIAYTLSYTGFRVYNTYSCQQSAPISLIAGNAYYIQVLHKQGGGGDNVSVQWAIVENPIPGNRLSPVPTSTTSTTTTTTTKAPVTTTTSIAPIVTSSSVSQVVNLSNISNQTISGLSIIGGSAPCLTLTNCSNIHITKNKFYNSVDRGIHLYNCYNITIDYNFFTHVTTGVYVEQTTLGGIVVNNNQFLNMLGPEPVGQFVQFNTVSGAGCSVSNNIGENIFGVGNPEDAINMYKSNGTAASPILIQNNWIRGGGPSSSGGGIMLGDNGGSYQTASGNILVNPGEYGMAIAGGSNISIVNNQIFGATQSFTNVGLYVDTIAGYTVSNATVSGNRVLFYDAAGYENNVWLDGNTQKPIGWDTANTWGDSTINASILPTIIITMS